MIVNEGGDNTFDDKTVRRSFIRKVYLILVVQLIITTAIVVWFYFEENTKRFVFHHPELCWLSIAMQIILAIVMACYPAARREQPYNYFILLLFTLFFSYMVAYMTASFALDSIFPALILTLAISSTLTLYAFQIKFDFTRAGAGLVICLTALLATSLIAILWQTSLMIVIYGSMGAIIFSFYLIYDSQLMLNGQHKYRFSPEEYVYAAFCLYTDIIFIFLFILMVFNAPGRE